MTDTENPKELSAKDEQRSAWHIIKNVIPYLWPDGQRAVKARVVFALALLVLSKVVATVLPLLQGAAVDSLSGKATDFILGAVGLTLAYGTARIFESGFQQLRDAVLPLLGKGRCVYSRSKRFGISTACPCAITSPEKPAGSAELLSGGSKGSNFCFGFYCSRSGL